MTSVLFYPSEFNLLQVHYTFISNLSSKYLLQQKVKYQKKKKLYFFSSSLMREDPNISSQIHISLLHIHLRRMQQQPCSVVCVFPVLSHWRVAKHCHFPWHLAEGYWSTALFIAEHHGCWTASLSPLVIIELTRAATVSLWAVTFHACHSSSEKFKF